MNFYLYQIKKGIRNKGIIATFNNAIFLLFNPIYRKLYLELILKSYSQNKEDLIAEELLGKKNIYYVDVGANSPDYHNNTKRFFICGSRGINIEPNPDRIKELKAKRPTDVNLNIAVSLNSGKKNLFIFNNKNNTMGTINEDVANAFIGSGQKLIKKISIISMPLKEIFAIHLKQNKIDILSIDTDGTDYQILLSNNWKKYRPKVIIIESPSEEMEAFLYKNKYVFYKETLWCAKTLNRIYYDMTCLNIAK